MMNPFIGDLSDLSKRWDFPMPYFCEGARLDSAETGRVLKPGHK